MASAETESYSPFQEELLNHLGQISSNVNTLITVFVNLQSSLLQNKAAPPPAHAPSYNVSRPLSPRGASPKSTMSVDSMASSMISIPTTKRKSLHDMMSMLDHRIPRDEPTIVEETSLMSESCDLIRQAEHDHDREEALATELAGREKALADFESKQDEITKLEKKAAELRRQAGELRKRAEELREK